MAGNSRKKPKKTFSQTVRSGLNKTGNLAGLGARAAGGKVVERLKDSVSNVDGQLDDIAEKAVKLSRRVSNSTPYEISTAKRNKYLTAELGNFKDLSDEFKHFAKVCKRLDEEIKKGEKAANEVQNYSIRDSMKEDLELDVKKQRVGMHLVERQSHSLIPSRAEIMAKNQPN